MWIDHKILLGSQHALRCDVLHSIQIYLIIFRITMHSSTIKIYYACYLQSGNSDLHLPFQHFHCAKKAKYDMNKNVYFIIYIIYLYFSLTLHFCSLNSINLHNSASDHHKINRDRVIRTSTLKISTFVLLLG